MGVLQKIREAVSGYKAYLTAIVGILTAIIAWGAGEITDVQFIGAVWLALQMIFIRAGVKKTTSDKSFNAGFDAGFDAGQEEGPA